MSAENGYNEALWSCAGESDLLASCYRRSLEETDCAKVKTIAFPAISAGIYGYPIAEATRIAVETCAAAEPATVEEVRFVAFNGATIPEKPARVP